ncbi:maleylpyruvate isomerase N-terminal domain-containing protein [Corynebacterium cystitidis]|uniref:maleylpyruvate isomerase N-terminal domain-containing protein n=1 Tax=Corynebacterium cystitidis TaxID=35757 RepID=UPI00211F2C73|nr:maleylpyruvate isomerase N-terminal domain-containing protein [Corynebacterium cystitidis]
MDSRTWLNAATGGLLEILPDLNSHLDQPGIGDWSVRALLGHTSRAYLLIEHFLNQADGMTGLPELESAGVYYRVARHIATDPQHDFERGPGAGQKLGEDPEATIREIIERVLRRLDRTASTALVDTGSGTINIETYIDTRAFEISMHTIDLARASDQPIPQRTLSTLDNCLALATDIATEDEKLDLLLAATGRQPLSTTFCLV